MSDNNTNSFGEESSEADIGKDQPGRFCLLSLSESPNTSLLNLSVTHENSTIQAISKGILRIFLAFSITR
jgi:hypothetical protein